MGQILKTGQKNLKICQNFQNGPKFVKNLEMGQNSENGQEF